MCIYNSKNACVAYIVKIVYVIKDGDQNYDDVNDYTDIDDTDNADTENGGHMMAQNVTLDETNSLSYKNVFERRKCSE